MSGTGSFSTERLRCAVYTRKSSEEGLDQEFNSLDAQREACTAFIASQAGLGWKLVPDRYDDGGISGGTMERPALQRLLKDIRERRIDVVVVYKIDRLTRSLMDFSKIVEILDSASASFVSVTQAFNTTTSMGRLTLNVLLSFAQFEREVTAERIRDKIAASKKKGIWMGGTVPIGYQVRDRRLLAKEPEASFVRGLFHRYLDLKSVPALAKQLAMEGAQQASSFSRPMGSGALYKLLSNPVYTGKLKHKQNVYDGEHAGLINEGLFQQVQQLMAEQAITPRGSAPRADIHLLTGLLFDGSGSRLRPTHATTRGRRYRYYATRLDERGSGEAVQRWRIPASELEDAVLRGVKQILSDRTQLSEWITRHGSASHVASGLKAVLEMTAGFAGHGPTALRSLLKTVLRKIVLTQDSIELSMDTAALVRILLPSSQSSRTEEDRTHALADDIVSTAFPLKLTRRGNGMRLVIEADRQNRSQPDRSLIHVLGRAHLYLAALTDGSANEIVDVARRFAVHPADVSRLLPLAFLSPNMADAILTGRQPVSLSARKLSRADLPALWTSQLAAFEQ